MNDYHHSSLFLHRTLSWCQMVVRIQTSFKTIKLRERKEDFTAIELRIQ